jgi:hypothetical protein
VSFFGDEGEAKEFINGILEMPQMVGKLSDEHQRFFVKLFEDYPPIKVILREYLSSKRNIYPNVEFFVLKILACSIREGEDIEFFVSTYFKALKPYQWYSRCLCISTFLLLTDFVFMVDFPPVTRQ